MASLIIACSTIDIDSVYRVELPLTVVYQHDRLNQKAISIKYTKNALFVLLLQRYICLAQSMFAIVKN